MIFCGCDRLLRDPKALAGRRYGLLAHAASVTEDLRPLHLALAASPSGPPAVLFGPEHGYWGVEQDMVASHDERDPATGVAVRSLYGDDEASLRPSPDAFAGLDLLLVDLQDVGSRYYTYAATAAWATEVALTAGLEVWILDRPNPLGGRLLEGPGIEEGFHSFVGAFDTPVRHGLTLGELVRLEGKRRGWPEDGLRVFTLAGWKRGMRWEHCRRPWIAPSPNMPTPHIAALYPGGCLFEGTTLSEGRGTTRPFQLVGAPGVPAEQWAQALTERRLDGFAFLPTYFKPQFQKHAGAVCGGVEILVTDEVTARPLRAAVEMLRVLRELAPDTWTWRREAYEFVTDRPAIDLLTGSADFRLALDGEASDLGDWLRTWRLAEDDFRVERRSILLYD